MATRIIATLGEKQNSVVVRYNSEYKEYIVQFSIDGKWQQNADYYTDDKNDALITAHKFLETDYYKQSTKYFAPLDEIREALENKEGIAGITALELKSFVIQSKEIQADLKRFENFDIDKLESTQKAAAYDNCIGC